MYNPITLSDTSIYIITYLSSLKITNTFLSNNSFLSLWNISFSFLVYWNLLLFFSKSISSTIILEYAPIIF